MFRIIRARIIFGFGAIALIISACGVRPAPVGGSCGLGDFSDDDSAIEATLNAEGELVAAKHIAALMALWDEDATITDAMHTPNDESDDRIWRGSDAIYQRYVYRVFPNAPAESPPKKYDITIEGDTAIATGTTRIGSEVSPGGDLWRLRRVNGCWLLDTLEFNRES